MTQRNVALLAACLLLLAACDPNANRGPGQHDIADEAVADAIEELQDQTYEDVRGSSECTEDCSGHNAGWEWAKEHNILEPDDCSGNSESFIEGCKAYGEEVESRTAESGDGPDRN